MKKKKIDKIIEAFRNYIILKEEGMVANLPGTQGGGGESSNPKGPFAGFSHVMSFSKRKGPQIKLPPGSRKRWMSSK